MKTLQYPIISAKLISILHCVRGLVKIISTITKQNKKVVNQSQPYISIR